MAEMMRLGVALKAKPQTLMGLAGMGDLVLTCTDNQSVEMPICNQVWNVLSEKLDLKTAIAQLLGREMKQESS